MPTLYQLLAVSDLLTAAERIVAAEHVTKGHCKELARAAECVRNAFTEPLAGNTGHHHPLIIGERRNA